MVEFTESLYFEAWLAALPNERRSVADRILSLRAALRVLPLTFTRGVEDFSEDQRNGRVALRRTLVSCRASSVALATALVPASQRELSVAALAAARAASVGIFGFASSVAAARAASAAARASALAAASAAARASARASTYLLLSADATEIEAHWSEAAEVLIGPLWPKRQPNWAKRATDHFLTTLQNAGDDWDVWARWYQDRLDGAQPDPDFILAIARIAEADWDKGPAHVNAIIKRLEKPRKPPERTASLLERLASAGAGNAWPPASIIKTRVSGAMPPALSHLRAAFEIRLNERNQMAAYPGSLARMVLPQAGSAQDKRQRLQALQVMTDLLLAKIREGGGARYQVRPEYREYLQELRDWMPGDEPESGNIILADACYRNLRALFHAEANELSVAFSAPLKVILENFQGLRVYYPEMRAHYEDIRTGSLTTPLPLDACEGFIGVIRDFTPSHFDPSVQNAAEASTAPAPPAPPAPPEPAAAGTPMPPPDPLGEVDPQKARDKEAGSYFNAVVKGLENVEKAGKAVEGFDKVKDRLAPYWRPIWEWLTNSGGDGPPMPPPTILT